MAGGKLTVRVLNTFLHFETATKEEEKSQRRAASCPPAPKSSFPGDDVTLLATRSWASVAKGVLQPLPTQTLTAPASPLPAIEACHTAGVSSSDQAVVLLGMTSIAKQGFVSLVLKNIPARCTLADLTLTIVNSGFQGKFDYMYMPMKRNALQNKGYVFVSFADKEQADDFCSKLEGRTSCGRRSAKVIEIEQSDVNLPIQQIRAMGHLLPPSPYGPLFAGRSKARGPEGAFI